MRRAGAAFWQAFNAIGHCVDWEADRDPAFKPWLSDGGLIAAIWATRGRLVKAPVEVAVKAEAGRPHEIVLGVEGYPASLPGAAQHAAGFPRFVLDAYLGRYQN